MKKIDLYKGIFAHMMENEAWGEISGSFPFSEEQLEKYADRLDWKAVSRNGSIFWTAQMLEKFKRRLHWDVLLGCMEEEILELLEYFKEN